MSAKLGRPQKLTIENLDNNRLNEIRVCLHHAIQLRKDASVYLKEITTPNIKKQATELINDYDIGMM